MFKPKMRVKKLNGNNDVILNKRFPLSETGGQILIKTSGGKGQGDKKIEPYFTTANVIREFNHWIKFWTSRVVQYVVIKNDKLIDFHTGTAFDLDENAIMESTEKRLLTKLGEEPKEDMVKWIGVVMSGLILLFLIAGSV